LAAARDRIAASGQRVEAIKGFYGPRVRAEGAFGWSDSDFLPEDERWSIGVTFQLPVFTGFARTHRVAEAAAEVRIVQAETEALADRVELEVWQAASQSIEAHQAVLETEVLRATARESLEFAVARYEAGASTITDLLDAESALSQADSAHVAAVFGTHLAQARLLRAQGDL
jgi:outer membrane protein TolC